MYHNIYRSTTRTLHHHLPSSIVEHSADRRCPRPGPIVPTIGPLVQEGVGAQAGGDVNVPSAQQNGPVRHCIEPGCPGGVSQLQGNMSSRFWSRL